MKKNNTTTAPKCKQFDQDSLFEQMATITKAHGYDILAKHVKELKEVIRELIEVADLEDLKFTDQEDNDKFKAVLNKAKILSL